MKKLANIFYGLVGLSLLSGCYTTKVDEPRAIVVQNAPLVAPVSGTDLDMKNMEKIRTSEKLKAYPIGRYIDPNNPDLMHEGHVVYRQEAPSSWNKSPNAPTAVPLGPTVAVSHPERQTEALNIEYETKIMQQNQLMKSLIDQNEALLEVVNKLSSEVNKLKEGR